MRSGYLGKSQAGGAGARGVDGVGERERVQGLYGESPGVKAIMGALMSEQLEKGFAEPEDVVGQVVKVLEREDGELPLRLLLGKDAVAAIEGLEQERRAELEKWREVSCGVGE
jgi:hypothetical protein